MARDPHDVICLILSGLPIGCTEDIQNAHLSIVRTKLEKLLEQMTYLPPENFYEGWRKLNDTIMNSLHTPPTHQWEKDIQDIMKNRATPTAVIEDSALCICRCPSAIKQETKE